MTGPMEGGQQRPRAEQADQQPVVPEAQQERADLSPAQLDGVQSRMQDRGTELHDAVADPIRSAMAEGQQAGVMTPADQAAGNAILSEAQQAKQKLFADLAAAKQTLEQAKQAWKELGVIGRLRSTAEKRDAQINLEEAKAAYEQALAEAPTETGGAEALAAHQAEEQHQQSQTTVEQYSSGLRNFFQREKKWQAIVDEGEAEDAKLNAVAELQSDETAEPQPGPFVVEGAPELEDINALPQPEAQGAAQPEAEAQQPEAPLTQDQLNQRALEAYAEVDAIPPLEIPKEVKEGLGLTTVLLGGEVQREVPDGQGGTKIEKADKSGLASRLEYGILKKQSRMASFYLDGMRTDKKKGEKVVERSAISIIVKNLTEANKQSQDLSGYIMQNRDRAFSPELDAAIIAEAQNEAKIAAEIEDILSHMEQHVGTRSAAKMLIEITLPSLADELRAVVARKQSILEKMRELPRFDKAKKEMRGQDAATPNNPDAVGATEGGTTAQEADEDDSAPATPAQSTSPFRAARQKREPAATIIPGSETTPDTPAQPEADTARTREAGPLPESHWMKKKITAAQADRRKLRTDLGLDPDNPNPTDLDSQEYQAFSNQLYDAEQTRLVASGLEGEALDEAMNKFEDNLMTVEATLRDVEQDLLEQGEPLIAEEGPEQAVEFQADVVAILGHLDALDKQLDPATLRIDSQQFMTHLNMNITGITAFERVLSTVSAAEHAAILGLVKKVELKMQGALATAQAEKAKGFDGKHIDDSVLMFLGKEGPAVMQSLRKLTVEAQPGSTPDEAEPPGFAPGELPDAPARAAETPVNADGEALYNPVDEVADQILPGGIPEDGLPDGDKPPGLEDLD